MGPNATPSDASTWYFGEYTHSFLSALDLAFSSSSPLQTADRWLIGVVSVVVMNVVHGDVRHDAAVVVGQTMNDARHKRSIFLIVILHTSRLALVITCCCNRHQSRTGCTSSVLQSETAIFTQYP